MTIFLIGAGCLFLGGAVGFFAAVMCFSCARMDELDSSDFDLWRGSE